jgi:hypothetical protein
MISLTGVWYRIYADFFMPSRLETYREFLCNAMYYGYEICSVDFLWQKIKNNGEIESQKKYLVLRHDIDTDTATAKAMWHIEKFLDVKSSYYFRLSTVDIDLMQEIELSGGEASYHFEEIASLVKRKHLKRREDVLPYMPYARSMFKDNLTLLRESSGLPMKIVAAHGDFANRKLGISNCEILQDKSFRQEVDIEMEVYDEIFSQYITSRHSDTSFPYFWQPESPLHAIQSGMRIIYVLIHPRQWRVNPKENFRDDIKRAWEGFCYSLG